MFFRKEKWRVYRMNSIVHSTIRETIFPFHRNKINKYGKRNIVAKVVSFTTTKHLLSQYFYRYQLPFSSVSFSSDSELKQLQWRWLRQSEKDFFFFFFSLFSFISSCGHIFPWKGMITEGWKLKTASRSNIRPIITYKNWIWYRHSKTGYNYTIETDWGRVIFTTDGCASPFNLRDIQRQMYPDEIFLEADTCFKHVVCSARCSEPWT